MVFPDVFLVPMTDQDKPVIIASPVSPLSPLATVFVPGNSDWLMLPVSVFVDARGLS